MAFTYRNGYVPESKLVIFKRGRNERDGDWFWGLSPSTYRKHLALVARAKKRTGRTLSPSDGWSTYRPYAAQEDARDRYGVGAAWPGTSSHGGYWEGRDTLAIDYGNWAWVYAQFGSRARAEFYADCRAVGLAPGMISKARGYPDEPWHVIDLDPWAPVPSGSVTPGDTTNKPAQPEEDEEDEMKNCGFYYKRASDGHYVCLIVNFGSGIYHEYSNGKATDGTYNGRVAAATGTGSYALITEAHARVIKAACDKADSLKVVAEIVEPVA